MADGVKVIGLLVGVAVSCILVVLGCFVVFLRMVGNEEGPQP